MEIIQNIFMNIFHPPYSPSSHQNTRLRKKTIRLIFCSVQKRVLFFQTVHHISLEQTFPWKSLLFFLFSFFPSSFFLLISPSQTMANRKKADEIKKKRRSIFGLGSFAFGDKEAVDQLASATQSSGNHLEVSSSSSGKSSRKSSSRKKDSKTSTPVPEVEIAPAKP